MNKFEEAIRAGNVSDIADKLQSRFGYTEEDALAIARLMVERHPD